MLLVEQHAVLRAGQAPGDLRRAGVVAQRAIGIEFADQRAIVGQQRRQVVAHPQAGDALQPLAGLAGLLAGQVVEADAGMAVEVGEGLVLACHQTQQAAEDGMLEHVGMVAGVKGVTVVHRWVRS
ncbi:hypothetical protein D3C86_1345000 [compost metagenome]